MYQAALWPPDLPFPQAPTAVLASRAVQSSVPGAATTAVQGTAGRQLPLQRPLQLPLRLLQTVGLPCSGLQVVALHKLALLVQGLLAVHLTALWPPDLHRAALEVTADLVDTGP